MFQAVFMVVAVVLLEVFETFVFHSVSLLIDESLSLRGFDYALERGPTHSSSVVFVSVHVVRRMSSAWLRGTTTLSVFNHKITDKETCPYLFSTT